MSSNKISKCCPSLDLKLQQPKETFDMNQCMCYNMALTMTKLPTHKRKKKNQIMNFFSLE